MSLLTRTILTRGSEISHDLNKVVTDLSNKEHDDNEQETSEMQFEDCALKPNVLAFASRSKAKAKPQRRIHASSSTRTLPIGERTWTHIEPQDYSPTDCCGNRNKPFMCEVSMLRTRACCSKAWCSSRERKDIHHAEH